MVNTCASVAQVLSSPPPYRTPIVPTMFSLAIRPVIEATAACQLPQLRGANIQAMPLPIAANMLLPISSSASIPNAPSTQPNRLRNQSTMVESRMIVPAFLMNDQPRSHIERSTLPIVGRWYAGSSITNGAGSPAKGFVCDGAAWHKANSLIVPENISIVFIPPYTPEMNPIEQIWKEIRKVGFRNEIFHTLDKVVERLCKSICSLSADTIKSITCRKWIVSTFN